MIHSSDVKECFDKIKWAQMDDWQRKERIAYLWFRVRVISIACSWNKLLKDNIKLSHEKKIRKQLGYTIDKISDQKPVSEIQEKQ